MNIIWRILPTVALVAYSQLIVKWRVAGNPALQSSGGLRTYAAFLFDPYILSGYVAGLLGSFFWIYTIARTPLAQAFPIYQGLTFLAVMAGAALILGEPMSAPKLIAVLLILAGVIIGAQA